MQDPSITAPVRKIARILGKAGQAQQLRNALILLERETQQEPGCIEFTFFQSISDDARFILLEHFANPAALQEHLQLPHTQAFFAHNS